VAATSSISLFIPETVPLNGCGKPNLFFPASHPCHWVASFEINFLLTDFWFFGKKIHSSVSPGFDSSGI
jgi:hypothetical protein